MDVDFIVVLMTVPGQEEAQRISQSLLKEKLVACVNVIPEVHSLYWWQGKIDNADEVLLVAKSRKSYFDKIKDCVRTHHSYEVPEILALPVVGGNDEYLNWIEQSLKTA